jgi:hypothetical protein
MEGATLALIIVAGHHQLPVLLGDADPIRKDPFERPF